MKFLKFIISIFSIAFLVYLISQSYGDIKSSLIFQREMIYIEILFLSFIYAFSLFGVAFGWKKILEVLLHKKIPFYFIFIWLKSNVYKYLPGNIFNYVERQIVANKVGVSHKVLIQSNVVEALLISAVSLLVSGSILILIYDFSLNTYFQFLNKYYIILSFLVVFVILICLIKYKNINMIKYWNIMPFYLLFFIGVGASAWYILLFQMELKISFLLITAIYSSAWLVGFITPGAPGGIGVRESVFVVFSNGILSESDAVLLSLMLRFSSIVGEMFLYLISQYILRGLKMKYKKNRITKNV